MSSDPTYTILQRPRIMAVAADAGAEAVTLAPWMSMPVDPCCPPLRPSLDEDEAGALAAVLKALADPARLRLLAMIASAPDGWACACDLAEPLGRSQATVSHHLTTLVRAELLEREQRGKWAWFRVRGDRLDAIRSALVLPLVDVTDG